MIRAVSLAIESKWGFKLMMEMFARARGSAPSPNQKSQEPLDKLIRRAKRLEKLIDNAISSLPEGLVEKYGELHQKRDPWANLSALDPQISNLISSLVQNDLVPGLKELGLLVSSQDQEKTGERLINYFKEGIDRVRSDLKSSAIAPQYDPEFSGPFNALLSRLADEAGPSFSVLRNFCDTAYNLKRAAAQHFSGEGHAGLSIPAHRKTTLLKLIHLVSTRDRVSPGSLLFDNRIDELAGIT